MYMAKKAPGWNKKALKEAKPIPGPRRLRAEGPPTLSQLMNIPVAVVREYELNDKECARLRARLYSINKDGICRYRTLREFNVLLVWRLK